MLRQYPALLAGNANRIYVGERRDGVGAPRTPLENAANLFGYLLRVIITPLVRRAALTAYGSLVLWATLKGLAFEPDLDGALGRFGRAFDLDISARDVVDGARNLALFAGWGAVWVSLSPSVTLRRTLFAPLITGLALSVVVETMQLFSPVRRASVLDVATNSIGSLLGAATIVSLGLLAVRLRDHKSFAGIPAIIFAGGYGMATLLQATIMGRPDYIPGLRGGPLARASAIFKGGWFEWGPFPVTELVLFFPLGWLLVATLVESGRTYPQAARATSVSAAVLAIAAELIRAPLGMPVHVWPVVVHAAAVAVGAWLAAYAFPRLTPRLRGRERARGVALAYAFSVALWAWSPFLPQVSLTAILEQLAPIRLVPLAALAPRMDLYSVADVAAPFFLYLPVGAYLAVWPARQNGWLSGCLIGIYLALGAEVSQLLVLDRFFSGTDILVAAAGVWLGFVVIRRSGYRVYGTLLVASGVTNS